MLQREAATAQSDLYAVGVIGYHLLTGRKPLGRYRDAGKIVRDLHPGWDDFLNGLMEGEPEYRTQSAEASLAVLPGEQEKAPEVEAPPTVAAQVSDKKPVPPSTEATASGPSRGKSLWIALAVVLLLAGGAGGWAFGIYLPQERAFEEMRERIATLSITAESKAVEDLDEAVHAFVDAARDRHVEPIEGAWAMRRDEIEMRREAFANLSEEIGSLSTDAPMAELEALGDVVDAYLRQAPEAHRDRIASEWAQQRAAIESYWENARGGLILDTEPSGAEVRLGGLSIEESPVRLSDLRLGNYAIDIVYPDYERWSGEVEVEDGRFTDLGTIELQRSTGGLRVSANVESLNWQLEKADGEIELREGEGRIQVEELPTGEYLLSIERDHWPERVLEFEVYRNEVSELELDYAEGSVEVLTEPAGIEVILEKDGAEWFREASPVTIESLPVGTYTVKAQRDGWPEQVHEVEIGRNEVAEVALEFPSGSLRLTSEPSGAEVWVGGARIGVTPYKIGELPPGNLRDFEFRKEGYVEQTASGRIEAGEELVLAVELVEGPSRGENYTVELGDGNNLDLIWIEPREFVMGSPSGESGRRENEGPQTTVRLTPGYWLGKTPVTQGQWQALMGTSVREQRDKANPDWSLRGEGSNYPVYYVSWTEAMEFCRKLTEGERAAGRLPAGYEYTLPSEAQWEYAARATSASSGQAGTTTRWSFGDSENSLGDYAWHRESSGGQTQPVATKRPNPWGLYDVHGNVWEWTRSWWQSNHPGGSVVDYEGPDSGTNRVGRGGSWTNTAANTRSAFRIWGTPGYRNSNLGFRLALAPAP